MRAHRKLVLRKETLAPLTGSDLEAVAAGATQLTFCGCPWSIITCYHTREINCTGACVTVEGC